MKDCGEVEATGILADEWSKTDILTKKADDDDSQETVPAANVLASSLSDATSGINEFSSDKAQPNTEMVGNSKFPKTRVDPELLSDTESEMQKQRK